MVLNLVGLITQLPLVRIVGSDEFPFKLNAHDYEFKISRSQARPSICLYKGSPIINQYDWESIFKGSSITISGPEMTTGKQERWDWSGNKLSTTEQMDSKVGRFIFEIQNHHDVPRYPLMFLRIEGSRGSSSLPTLKTWAFIEPQLKSFMDIRFSITVSTVVRRLGLVKGNAVTFEGVTFKTGGQSKVDGKYKVSILYRKSSKINLGVGLTFSTKGYENSRRFEEHLQADGSTCTTIETDCPFNQWKELEIWKSDTIDGYFEKVAMQPMTQP